MGNDRYNQDRTKNPYRVNREPVREPTPTSFAKPGIDFETQRICLACGKVIKIGHNFCKFCGVDLSGIQPLGYSDRTLKELANTALTDPNPGVRKDAVDTLGDLGENEVLGVFAYILINDRDEIVRQEAADELGEIGHPHSLDVLARALKDPSPIVRKEAIEGLKKIKKKNKPEKKAEAEKEEEEVSKPVENGQNIADHDDLEDEDESEEDTLKEIDVEDKDEDSYEL
jgi:hypothetical protein